MAKLRKVNLKRDFGFVEFSDPRDADDARHDLDGRKLDGSRIVVEFARGARELKVSISAWKGPRERLLKVSISSAWKGPRERLLKVSVSSSWKGAKLDSQFACAMHSSFRSPTPRDCSNTGGEELPSRSPQYSPNPRRNLPPREQAERNGSYHGGSPRRGEARWKDQ
nr:unnamed protein product [Digitaria exilis]